MLKHKVILVLLDGLNYTVAQECMGHLGALVDGGLGHLYKVKSQLPSMSRPLYECILTGVKPIDSGVVHNGVVRLSYNESIFSIAKAQGLVTAASAYHWISELYNKAPFDPVRDRIVNDESLNIAHGVFYQWDDYPDEAVILDAEHLRLSYDPDFLFIHPMNVDDTGHHFGFDSKEYRNSARKVDIYLSYFLGLWLKEGYQVIVTSDHGMNNDGTHGGLLSCECEVPCFVFGKAFSFDPKVSIEQTQIAGLCLDLLGLKHDKALPKGVIGG